MSDCPTPKPMPTTPIPDDRVISSNDQVKIGKGVQFGKMQVTNGRKPGGK